MSQHTLRKKFVKDFGLPITIYKSPYFEYYLELYEDLYQSKTLYQLFEREVLDVGGIEPYLAEYTKLKNRIIEHVKDKESFQRFNGSVLSEFDVKMELPKTKLYHPENHGNRFVSIDLEKANFHSLRYYDTDILDGAKTYNQWLKQFTQSAHIARSKNLRQVIFGNLNPKKQQKLQKHITHSFLQVVEQFVPNSDIMSASHDEIIIRIDQELDKVKLQEELEKVHNKAFPLHVEEFVLKVQNPHLQYGYVKEYVDEEKVEFKGVPACFMAQAYKKHFQLPLEQNDLLFFYEGRVAAFVNEDE